MSVRPESRTSVVRVKSLPWLSGFSDYRVGISSASERSLKTAFRMLHAICFYQIVSQSMQNNARRCAPEQQKPENVLLVHRHAQRPATLEPTVPRNTEPGVRLKPNKCQPWRYVIRKTIRTSCKLNLPQQH